MADGDGEFEKAVRHMEPLISIGVTGTNGKTTVTHIVRHFLEMLGMRCGLVGTLMWITGDKTYTPTHTTPDAKTLRPLLAEMIASGCSAVAMEVSSHALVQKRTSSIDFRVAVFTNLTQDHLDYHKTMEAYAAAKAGLFSGLKESAWAVVNGDDPYADFMVQQCRASVVTYGMRESVDCRVVEVERGAFTIQYKGENVRVQTPLVGFFNVYNVLAAISTLLALDFNLARLAEIVPSLPPISGRMERIPNSKNLQVFVDYAHTPDALEKVLQAARERATSRVIVVYGCGGGRDPVKRPLMGRLAEQFADVAILTSDNPRSEDPAVVAEGVLKGCLVPEKTIVELDRKRAIEQAIQLATEDDVVVIAGKGHEKTQVFADRVVPFDDAEVVRLFIEGAGTPQQ